MTRFPDPRYARGDVVAIGDDLRVETLRDAYRHGIFPWPHDNLPMPWFSPRRRAVIMFEELHVGRSLRKAQRRSGFTYSIDRAFDDVIAYCAETPRGDETGTWIAPEIITAYRNLHRAGDAHSVEVWRDDALIGGLYGIDSGGAFTGESMFHEAPRSRRALARLSGDDTSHGSARRSRDIAKQVPGHARGGAGQGTLSVLNIQH
jgi:leucyl/phenylalanyl-tRNA--protein transferase